jgi:hypothetical protein
MNTETTSRDGHRLAAAARSILSCPGDVELVVDGVSGGLGDHLDLREDGGRPVLSCPAGSPLAVAATDGRAALLTVASGLGRHGSPDRDATLTLSGRLDAVGLEQCACCDEVRMRITLHLDLALLSRGSEPAGAPESARLRVPLGAFASPTHELNRGFLQRATEHANLCHVDELRHAVATSTRTRLGDVIAVQLTELSAQAVVVQWVDPTGAHTATLSFPRPARTKAELGELLRSQLHAGLC